VITVETHGVGAIVHRFRGVDVVIEILIGGFDAILKNLDHEGRSERIFFGGTFSREFRRGHRERESPGCLRRRNGASVVVFVREAIDPVMDVLVEAIEAAEDTEHDSDSTSDGEKD